MARPDTAAGVAMKIFVKQREFPPVRIFRESGITAVAWTSSGIIRQKQG